MSHPGFSNTSYGIPGAGSNSYKIGAIEIAIGSIPRYSSVHKYGKDTGIASTYGDVWNYAGNITFLSSTTTLSAVSTNAADNGAGLGARTLVVQGVDGNFQEYKETITLSGTTPVALNGNTGLRRVNRMYVSETGKYDGSNVGNIIVSSTAGQVQSYIAAGEGQAQMSIFTIPAGKVGVLTSFQGTSNPGTTKTADFRILRRNNSLDGKIHSIRLADEFLGIEGTILKTYGSPVVLQEMTDIWVQAKGASTPDVTATFDIVLIGSS